LLVSILLPSLAKARTLARAARAHAELRAITLAMALYRHENKQQTPPTRFSCSTRSAYDLPVELLPYLLAGRKNGVTIVRMPDPFTPEECYKYRAVGPAIVNESTVIPNASSLWVPDGFPGAEADTGSYHGDPKTSPVRYAVYSLGPDPQSATFDVPGRLPLPRKYWLRNASGAGVIVHYEDAQGLVHVSP
jgi:hypothetical protein